jgi:membrane protein required for colicin V production
VNLIDLCVVVIVLLSASLGFSRGFVRSLLTVLHWIGAAFATLYGFEFVRPYAVRLIGEETLAEIAAGVGLFLVTLVVLVNVSNMVAYRINESRFKPVDRSLGFLFGIGRGAVLISLAWMGLVAVGDPRDHPDVVREARTLPIAQFGAELINRSLPTSYRLKDLQEGSAGHRSDDRTLPGILRPPARVDAASERSGYNTDERREIDRLFQTNK